MKGKISRLLFFVMIAVAANSCQAPESDSHFIAASEALDGLYSFEAEFSDKDALYETFIIARLDSRYERDSVISLDICLKGRKGEFYVERVDFPLFKATGDVKITGRKDAIKEMQWPYRFGIRGGESEGKWLVRIEPSDPKDKDTILGMGFCYRKTKQNGKG